MAFLRFYAAKFMPAMLVAGFMFQARTLHVKQAVSTSKLIHLPNPAHNKRDYLLNIIQV